MCVRANVAYRQRGEEKEEGSVIENWMYISGSNSGNEHLENN